jgi:hypothetical protein
MTTLAEWNWGSLVNVLKDVNALEITRRVIQAEVLFHESRVGALKELDSALEARIKELGGRG